MIEDIDGDEFAESDYGLVVDNSEGLQKLQSQMETLAQAALQNQTLSFSTIMKVYNSSSLAEKQRLIEKDERAMQERQAQAAQEERESAQLIKQMELEAEQAKLEHEDILNQRDNETKILVAEIGAASKQGTVDDGIKEPEQMSEAEKEKLRENIRQFDLKLKLEKDKLEETKRSNKANEGISRTKASRPTSSK